MRGLALKIFLGFWLIHVVLFGSFALLPDRRPDGRFLDHVRQIAAVASTLLDDGNARGCQELASAAQRAGRVEFVVFDGGERAICAPAGMNLETLTLALRANRDEGVQTTNDGALARVRVSAGNGERRFVVARTLPGFALQPELRFPYGTIAFAILVSGVVCFALARYLARPLQQVRDVSYRLASGDLHARVGPRVGRRRDEIGDLVRDFDTMASRIESLVQAQGQLLSDISHELRSPLARLNVALELARRKTPAEVQPDLDRIETEAARMNELVGRVLTLARAETARTPAAHRPVPLRDLLETLVADAQYEAQQQDKAVDLHANAAPIVSGDPRLLASAVENVLRNAIRYSPPGTMVTVDLDATADEARIEIQDRGPGVPPSQLERIFAPFHRVEPARDRESGGVGLGLAIARRAVAVHRGSITAGNAEGGGLVITIRLPLASDTRSDAA